VPDQPVLDENQIRLQSLIKTIIMQRDNALNSIGQLQGEIEVLKARGNKKSDGNPGSPEVPPV
jgi:hypothetical protein